MRTIERFEDIEAWQKARELTKMVYQLSASGAWAKDFALRDQIRRAAISALSNIAEGFERGGDIEFAYFPSIAKGSAGEVRAQLYVALDQGFIDEKQFNTATEMAKDTSRLIAGFIRYLRQPKRKQV